MNEKMKLIKVLLFFLLFYFVRLESYLNLTNDNSIFKISGNSKVNLKKPINNIKGKIIKKDSAKIEGSHIHFLEGAFQDSESKTKLNGTIFFKNKKHNNIINLSGEDKIEGKLGKILDSIEVTGKSNYLEGYLYLKNDIKFKNSDSDAFINILNSLPVNLDLNGGSITLLNNLSFTNSKSINGSGTVNLNGYKLKLNQESSFNDNLLFNGLGTLSLTSDLYVNKKLTFSGTCIIDGNDNHVIMEDGGLLFVKKNSTLILKNLSLINLKEMNLKCEDNSATVIFRNIDIYLLGDFNFENGNIIVYRKNTIHGQSFNFHFKTIGTLTIKDNSILKLTSGITFIYEPSNHKSSNQIIFETDSAVLFFNNATFAINYGSFNFLKGSLWIKNNVIFYVNDILYENNNSAILGTAIFFGDNIDKSNDIKIKFYENALLNLKKGNFVYQNTDSESFTNLGLDSYLALGQHARFSLNRSIDQKKCTFFLANSLCLKLNNNSRLNCPISYSNINEISAA